jgi:hypothetical protein
LGQSVRFGWIDSLRANEYKQELAAVRDVINGIVANPSLTVDGTSYTLDPYLVLDMKSLCVMLGLYEVYRSNCKFRCCWCHCTKDKIGVFNIDLWSFRSIAQMKADAELNKTPSLLDFPLERIIPCSLHLMMGITRKLLKDLASQIDRDSNRTELITKTKEFFSSLKITLWSPKSPSAQDEFAEVIRRSSVNMANRSVILNRSIKSGTSMFRL